MPLATEKPVSFTQLRSALKADSTHLRLAALREESPAVRCNLLCEALGVERSIEILESLVRAAEGESCPPM